MATDSELRTVQRLVGVKDDGQWGSKTQEAIVAWLNARGFIEREAPPPDVMVRSRASVVAYALSQVGEQDPNKYFRDAAPQFIGMADRIAWCGCFWLWCLRQAGLTTAQWKTGVGFAGSYPRVLIPEPGDGMYFGTPLHHYAVVERVENGKVYTIEGNTMPAPKEGVTRRVRGIEDVKAGGGCYFSIRGLVRP